MKPENTREKPSLLTGLIRYRFVMFPAALLLLAAGWPLARQLEFDQSIESLYPDDDLHLLDYQQSKRSFGGDEFAVVAYSDPELMDGEKQQISTAAIERVQELTKRLNELRGIEKISTQNLAAITDRTRKLAEIKARHKIQISAKIPFLRKLFDTKEKREQQIQRVEKTALARMHRLVEGILIGRDKQTTTVVLRLSPESESTDSHSETDKPVSRGETIVQIRKIAAAFGKRHGFHVAVVGEPVQVQDMFRYVEEDGEILFVCSLLLLALVIFALFGSVRWVALPLLVVVTAIVWTEALLFVSGTRLSMVSSMLNSLVTIIGIATVSHITVHYREARKKLDRVPALRKTLGDLLPAIFWTSATTAVGFASLISSDIMPVRSFGLMMALATLLVFISVVVVVPGGVLFGRFALDPGTVPAEAYLTRFLERSATAVLRRPRLVVSVMLGVAGFSAAGFTRLTVETDFSENFRESSPIVQSLNVVETKLGGAGTWEVNFPAPKDLYDRDPKVQQHNKKYLAKVRKLTEKLREKFVRNGDGEVTKVASLTDGLKMLSPPLFLSLHEQLDGLKFLHTDFIPGLYDPHAGRMRIVLRGRERQQSAQKLKVIAAVNAVVDDWAKTELKEDFPHADAKVTGLYVLLAYLIDNLLKDQLLSFGLAAAGIATMMTIAFRSPLIGLISLLPNLFPILLVIGSMGWLGLPVNIATAMIASVSMGLTVDSSIHYISGYRRALRRGCSVDQALRDTQGNVGRALVLANLALIVGFSVLTLSHFIPLVYFGILVSVAMFGGLVGNLVLLPLLLGWIGRR